MAPRTQTRAPAAPAAQPKTADGRRKFTPRAPATVAERLPKLYRALTDQVNDGYFDNAKKTCKRILTLDAASTSAFQTLLFLYLHTDDYTSALELVNNPPAPSPPALEFERAYCLYRLKREREALAELEKIASRDRQEKHLEAQVRYRLGEYDAAQAVYNELLASAPPSSSEAEDIRTNMAATAAHISFITRNYTAHLTAPVVDNGPLSAGTKAYTPQQGEVESYIPTVPTGWARALAAADNGGKVSTAAAASSSKKPAAVAGAGAAAEKKRDKPRHALPKGAVLGKPFTQDPDRWLPLRQRASYLAPTAGKGGKKKELTGLGTQGSTSGGGGGGGAGGGGNKKKGKKK